MFATSFRAGLLISAGTAALFCSVIPALAQDAAGPGVETVVVSSTRVEREGFVSPTPETQISAQDIKVGGSTNIASVLATLPAYTPIASTSATNRGVNGVQNTANLRDLGVSRTLVLVDGTRPVTTTTAGAGLGFDLNLLPTGLIKRVDVVTGGASAQWGSDAVSGVVNVVMDNNFSGLQLNLQDGSDFSGYATNEFAGYVVGGTSFAGDQGHIVAGVEYANSRGVYNPYRNISHNAGLIANPAFSSTCGCAQNLFVTGLLNSNASVGGLITAGPLKGTNFGVNGTTSQFQYGLYGLNSTSGGFMVGGDPTARLFSTPPTGEQGYFGSIVAPQVRASIYLQASYKLADDVTMTVTGLVGHFLNNLQQFGGNRNLGNITIQKTNAYLPTSIVAAMTANNVTSFSFGRQNEDFGPTFDQSVDTSQNYRVALNGSVFKTWAWDAFYSWGQNYHRSTDGNQEITANFANSVNAVISPTTGQPVCAIALTNPSTTCVPVNLFGPGSASLAARNYFLGASTANITLLQHEAAVNLHGEPFALWAGPVSVAAGIEYRFEGVGAHTDALTAAKAFTSLNVPALVPFSYQVTEGYFETVVPLARDLPLAQNVDLNAAIRESGYSTAGVIPSWKVGVTDHVTDDLLLRAAVSRDIRAPNLAELAAIPGANNFTVTLPSGASNSGQSFSAGNPALKAETADSWTVGATYHAGLVGDLNLSLDYYSIQVKNAIGAPTAQTLVNQCLIANLQPACATLTITNGAVTQINSSVINFASFNTEGIDLEADYNYDMSGLSLPGTLSVRLLGTYITLLKQYQGTFVTPIAGDVSQYGNRLRATGILGYTVDDITGTARMRFIGGGAFSNTTTVDQRVPDIAFLDLGLEWRLPTASFGVSSPSDVSLYVNANNVLGTSTAIALADAPGEYDLLGTTYNVGIRIGF
jgi:outer membrane receptor protein involved in Fe transport